jgi:hypothetical protein
MTADPLNRFLQVRGPALRTPTGKPLNSGEHVWVGDDGAVKACKAHHLDENLLSSISRLDDTVRLSYGEIVALSGDFYASPDELFEERPGPMSWLYEEKDLSDLQAMFDVELEWIRKDAGKTATNYPDQNLRMWWNAKGYLELALANVDHFGWHNMKAYVGYHDAALSLAAAAAGRDDETFRRAVYTNAFADHFLTDGFAAGHLRVPRQEICEWAESARYSQKLAGALSKLLHDQDGHVNTLHSAGETGRSETDGLAVRNARGDAWFTRCDGQLFLPPEADKTLAVRLPVRAVAASVGELLVAWKQNALPPGEYAATALVAVPDPAAPRLIDKFPADATDDHVGKLLESVGWYTGIPWIGPGLNEENLRAFFRALPELMQSFRNNIAADLDKRPDLSRRLAAGYVAAYRTVA